MTDYVRKLWYMAAWEEEVPDEGMLARTLLDENWIVLRKEGGDYAMLRDRCPHRFVALSKGRRIGDTIRCAYHGLGFDSAGACVFNPFGGDVPPGTKVPTMPVVAKDSIVWFWAGDPLKADPSVIPDFSFVRGAEHNRGRYEFPVDYRLVVDNLMDLSHAEFIHIDTFGANGGLLEYGQQNVVEHEDGSIANNWDISGAIPPAFAKEMLPEGSRIDQRVHIRWHAPASMALTVAMMRSGPCGDDVVPAMTNPHILTPETAKTTHYFFTDGPSPGARDLTEAVFKREDEPMVASAQAGMGGRDFWECRPVILPTDAAAIRVRRRMMKLLRDEQRDFNPTETAA